MFHGPGPGRPKGLKNKTTSEQRRFAEQVVGTEGTPEREEFVKAMRAQLLSGVMAPAVANTILFWWLGKPTERIEIQEAPPDYNDLTADELRERSLAVAKQIVQLTPSEEPTTH